MRLSELDFDYPENLIGLEPQKNSRVMMVRNQVPVEIDMDQLIEEFKPQDILVINDTQVLPRRVFAGQLEILFLKQLSDFEWEVLFPSKKTALGESIFLPHELTMTLIKKGRPQTVRLSRVIDESYFSLVGELPLPPYIQKARQERHNLEQDRCGYQTAWASRPGSFAAPTASLHFKQRHLDELRRRGVKIISITLHVGLGTFLPVLTEDLDDHKMHGEYVEIKINDWHEILKAKSENRFVWALGTTTTRTLESQALGILSQGRDCYFGETQLLIQPGFNFKIVDRLLTNFHQPKSTLLALVAAFSDLSTVKNNYEWAIDRQFKLFSYGDLSCWFKKSN